MRKFLIWLLCTLTIACNPRPVKLTEGDKAQTIREVQDFFQGYGDAVRSNGLTAELDFLDQSPDFFWVPPGYTTPISYDSVAAVLKSSAGVFKSVDNRYDSIRIIPMTRELAVFTVRLQSAMKDTTEHHTILQLIETGIVIKRNGAWKLLCGQTSLIH